MVEQTTTFKDGSKVAYNVFNEGATDKLPLVLIMGLSGTMLDWQMFAEGIAKAGERKVVIFDNRNIGNSYGEIGAMTLDQLAGDTIELIEHLNLKEIDLLGFSMGGMIAQQILLNRAPNFKINKIILASSACRSPPSTKIDMSSEKGAQAFTLSLFDEEWVKNNTAIIALIQETAALKRRPLETMQAQLKSLHGLDFSEQLSKSDFTDKIYIMHGKRDAIIKFEEAEYMLSTIKGAKYVNNLPSVEYGHMFPVYFDPKTWSDAIESCLCNSKESTL
ncbi:alpha/beta-hydrolase [Wallemia mellicola]|nr:alpha/beta-hydrolase [Wallemia mellicola]TIC72378.1 alpha/beta-hydrolase [Wallemia mellicola]